MRRVPIADLAAGPRTLDGATGHYLARVLRLARGDRFEAFGGGRVALASVTGVSGEHVSVLLDPPEERAASAAAIVWIHAVPKGDKPAAIVQDATELGATAIVLAPTERSVVRIPEEKRAEREARLRKVAEEAARQSGRADVPEVVLARDLDAALATIPDDALRIALHPRDARPLADVLAPGVPVAFVTGPEGGLTDGELALLERAGFVRAVLGRFVLRTETTPAAILGAVAALARTT